jgi:hypothetical protein
MEARRNRLNPNQISFNIAQLATLEQARETARKLSAGPIVVGDGVRPETADQETSGIYRPSWISVAWSPEPYYKDEKTGHEYFYLHCRFNNRAEGMNVGLIMDMFKRYPNSPLYVLRTLAAEANLLASS